MKRRDFLKTTGLATGSLLIPKFLKAMEHDGSTTNGKTMVVIQLSGGNDGLNTVVPYRNDTYYQLRPTLGIQKTNVLDLNQEMGLHPEMKGLKELYDQGWLSIINNVGYPNPNRSHFRSMDIWHSASDAKQYRYSGWLGRYLDSECKKGKPVDTALEIDDTLSLAMKGEQYKALATQNPKSLFNTTRGFDIKQPDEASNHNLNYLYKTLAETQSSAQYLHQQSSTQRSKATYPKGKFGNNLKNHSRIDSGRYPYQSILCRARRL